MAYHPARTVLLLIMSVVLTAGFSHAAYAASASVDFSRPLKTIPDHFYGAVTGGITGSSARIDVDGDGKLETPADFALHRQKLLEAKVGQVRMDMDIRNVMNADGSFNHWTNCNTCSIDNAQTTVAWAAANGITVKFVAAYMPNWLANNASTCVSNHGRCEPSNYTVWGDAVVSFLDEVECDQHPGTCSVEVWNEPYLDVFWLPDGTCQDRIDAYFRMYNATRSAVKATYPRMEVDGPTGFTGSSCGQQFTDAFLAAYKSTDVDTFLLHEYGSGSTSTLWQEVDDAIDRVRAAGHTEPICFTEYNVNNAAINLNDPNRHANYLAETLMTVLNRPDAISCMMLFQWTDDSKYSSGKAFEGYPANYIMFSEPALDNQQRASFSVSKDFGTYHASGRSVLPSTGSGSVKVLASQSGAGGKQARITLLNTANATTSVTLSTSGLGAAVAQTLDELVGGKRIAFVNGVATVTLPPYAVVTYGLTTVIPDTTPPVVAILAPRTGTSVSNPLAVNWTATDNKATTVGCNVILDGVQTGTQTLANNTIATRTLGNLSAGTHTTTITCSDGANNASGSVTYTVTAPQNATPTYVWLQAETTTSITQPMLVGTDSAASGGKYVSAPNGKGSDTGYTTYTVRIPKSGIYVLWARTKAPSVNDDSVYIQIDSGKKNLWDVPRGTAWSWAQAGDRGYAHPVYFTLASGTHTLTLWNREDGTQVDKFLLTDALTYTPTGTGQ